MKVKRCDCIVRHIKKTKQKEWECRLYSLKIQVSYWMDNVPEKMVEVIELFF